MTALEFAAWMIAHPDAQYEKLVALFEFLDVFEQEALRATMRVVADRGDQAEDVTDVRLSKRQQECGASNCSTSRTNPFPYPSVNGRGGQRLLPVSLPASQETCWLM